MLNSLKALLVAAGAVAVLAGAVQAQPSERDITSFDVRNAGGWADRLALCDATAFLATKPDFNAQRIWVRRDDGHADVLLPPNFVGGGWWYKEGYERLYWRMLKDKKVDSASMHQAQDTVSREFIRSYRSSANNQDRRFLDDQDTYCRAMAREQGEIIF